MTLFEANNLVGKFSWHDPFSCFLIVCKVTEFSKSLDTAVLVFGLWAIGKKASLCVDYSLCHMIGQLNGIVFLFSDCTSSFESRNNHFVPSV